MSKKKVAEKVKFICERRKTMRWERKGRRRKETKSLSRV